MGRHIHTTPSPSLLSFLPLSPPLFSVGFPVFPGSPPAMASALAGRGGHTGRKNGKEPSVAKMVALWLPPRVGSPALLCPRAGLL